MPDDLHSIGWHRVADWGHVTCYANFEYAGFVTNPVADENELSTSVDTAEAWINSLPGEARFLSSTVIATDHGLVEQRTYTRDLIPVEVMLEIWDLDWHNSGE